MGESTIVHFLNVGHGDMTLLQLADGTVFLYDCYVTPANEREVLAYLGQQLGQSGKIDTFVCSRRAAAHMRGIKRIHARFPIGHVWDTGMRGATPGSVEYTEYMELRNAVGASEVSAHTQKICGKSRVRIMNGTSRELPDNPTARSIVLKVEHGAPSKAGMRSVLLPGDTDAEAWRLIRSRYGDADLKCSLLLASHHGSLSFFADDGDPRRHYTSHIRAMSPSISIVSVGDNVQGHPHPAALGLYEEYSTGSADGTKVFRTDTHGHMQAVLSDDGWTLSTSR